MKIDREHYENYEYQGRKYYEYKKVNDKIGSYEGGAYYTVYFETETEEIIGTIFESDCRNSWKTYFNAECAYGWDGKPETSKSLRKTLCTRANYSTAYSRLMNEYKSRKAKEAEA